MQHTGSATASASMPAITFSPSVSVQNLITLVDMKAMSIREALLKLDVTFQEFPKIRGSHWFVIKLTEGNRQKVERFTFSPLKVHAPIGDASVRTAIAANKEKFIVAEQDTKETYFAPDEFDLARINVQKTVKEFNALLDDWAQFPQMKAAIPPRLFFQVLALRLKLLEDKDGREWLIETLMRIYKGESSILTREDAIQMTACSFNLLYSSEEKRNMRAFVIPSITTTKIEEFLKMLIRIRFDMLDPEKFFDRDPLERLFTNKAKIEELQESWFNSGSQLHAYYEITKAEKPLACSMSVEEYHYSRVITYMTKVANHGIARFVSALPVDSKEAKEKDSIPAPASAATSATSSNNAAAKVTSK